GTLYQTYVTPVFADQKKEQVFGILSGGVFPRLQRIDYLLKGLQQAQDNFILITDSRGHFITSDGITDKEAGEFLQNHLDEANKRFFGSAQHDTKAQIVEGVHVSKYTYIIMSLPMDELKLVVTLGVNMQRIESKRKELSYRLLVALEVGLLLTVVSSII